MGTRLVNVEAPMSQVKLHTITRIKKVKVRKSSMAKMTEIRPKKAQI